MTELEMIKAFAKLDGVKLTPVIDAPNGIVERYVIHQKVFNPSLEYNPIADLALTFKAMVKYDVDVIISEGLVEIDGEHITFYQKDSLLPKAIIECILKSKGLYK